MSKTKSRIEAIGLNYKKEIFKIVFLSLISIVLGVVVALVFINWWLVFIGVGLSLIITITFLFIYSSKESTMIKNQERDFSKLLTYFRIFIANSYNVYNAFEESMTYVDSWTKDKISLLLKDIDEDKTVIPYIRFARNYKPIIIEQIMVSIYQMVEDGTFNNYLGQFSILYNHFSDTIKLDRIEGKKKSLEGTNVFPLIGAGIITMIIAIGIIGILGDIISGI